MHTYIHTHIHTYLHIHTYTHTYIHTYVRTYIHTYIHTYINTSRVSLKTDLFGQLLPLGGHFRNCRTGYRMRNNELCVVLRRADSMQCSRCSCLSISSTANIIQRVGSWPAAVTEVSLALWVHLWDSSTFHKKKDTAQCPKTPRQYRQV